MGRTPAPIVVHRLSPGEQRVLACFLNGRLPAGRVHAELAQARAAAQAVPAAPPAPVPSAVAA
jgi:hypothetical protein